MKIRTHKIADSYLDLIHRFPLRPIRTDGEYDEAADLARELAIRGEDDLDTGETDYLDALDQFIMAYDAAHHRIDRPNLNPLTRLKMLMKETGMTVSDLGRVIGSQPGASMMLSGSRQISKAQIKKLSDHFKLNSGYFL